MNPNVQGAYTVQPVGPPPPQYQGVPPAPPMIVQKTSTRSSRPANVTCQYCHQNVMTNTEAKPGLITWVVCAGAILFGFWLGCCLIPFCIDDLQDTIHTCPNCKNEIDVYKPLS